MDCEELLRYGEQVLHITGKWRREASRTGDHVMNDDDMANDSMIDGIIHCLGIS